MEPESFSHHLPQFFCDSDDGISPERVAMVMGQPDRCQHAVHLINDLIQTAQVTRTLCVVHFYIL